MTLKNLVKRSEVIGLSQTSLDSLIIEKLKVTGEDLFRIRAQQTVAERVLEAARTLERRLSEAGVDQGSICAQFTLMNIGLLAKDQSLRTEAGALVTNVLRRQFGGEKRRVERETGLCPTYTQLLRESMGIYKGNLYEAKKRWPKLIVSEYDWLKDIRIPVSLGVDEGFLIGFYFSQANPAECAKEGRNVHTRLMIYGRNTQFPLYDNIAVPLMRSIHNFSEEETKHYCHNEERKRRKAERGEFEYNIPGFELTSAALATWLVKELGLPLQRKGVVLPHIEEDAGRFGMMQGVIASEGMLYVYPGRTRMRIESTEEAYVESIKQLSEGFGLSPNTIRGSGTGNPILDFGKSDVIEMARLGILRNPDHIAAVKQITGDIVEDQRNPALKFSLEQMRLLAFLYNCNVQSPEISKYFGFNETSTSHYLDIAESDGFNILRRRSSQMPSHNVRKIDDVLKMYDRDIPAMPHTTE